MKFSGEKEVTVNSLGEKEVTMKFPEEMKVMVNPPRGKVAMMCETPRKSNFPKNGNFCQNTEFF